MEQNVKSKGVTLADILRMFKGKIVLLVCLTLVAAILGGAVAVLTAVLYGDYGTSVEFYVSPVDDSHSLLPILQSEAFAEKLLLEENGLPEKSICNPADYDAALAAINATKAAREAKYQAKKALDRIPYDLAPIQNHYDHLQSVYHEAFSQLELYKSANSDFIADDENHQQKIKEYEIELKRATEAKENYYSETYAPMIAAKYKAEVAYKEATDALDEARRSEEKLVEKVLSAWRSSDAVQKNLKSIYDGVSFAYATREVKSGSSTSQVENYNFIKVTVFVPNDEEFAAELLGNIKAITPAFVENNIEKLTGEVEVECTLMSTFSDVDDLNGGGMIKNAVTYALVAAVAVFALTCIIIIGKNLIVMIFAADAEEKAESEAEQKDENYTNV